MITSYQIKEFVLDTAAKNAVSDLATLTHRELLALITVFSSKYDFCAEYYIQNNPFYSLVMDPLEHFIRYGLARDAAFKISERNEISSEGVTSGRTSLSSASDATISQAQKQSQLECSILICAQHPGKHLLRQIEALRNQSIDPTSISVVCHELPPASIRGALAKDIDFIQCSVSPIDYAFNLAVIQNTPYIAVLEESVLPGNSWLMNSLRVCTDYNAIATAKGKVFEERYYQETLISKKIYLKDVDSEFTDVYCDTGSGAWVFMREWAPFMTRMALSDASLPLAYMYPISLFVHLGISCVAPISPSWAPEFGVEELDQGNHGIDVLALDASAISGYIPVRKRDNVIRFHIITSFGSREMLQHCISSVVGQIYSNYTLTLIDDCMDHADIQDIIVMLEQAGVEFRYIRNKIKMGAMGGQTLATDSLTANPADVIIHLDGDDWFAHPHVLWQLNKIYLVQNAAATYGNMLSLNNTSHNFSDYSVPFMSKTWNMVNKGRPAECLLVRRFHEEDLRDGWGSTHWWALHTRSFRFTNWLLHNRKAFRLNDGSWLERISDAAIMVPMLDALRPDDIIFVPDVSYIYQNLHNTNHFLNPVTDQEDEAIKTHIANCANGQTRSPLLAVLNHRKNLTVERVQEEIKKIAILLSGQAHKENSSMRSISPQKISAVTTIITPNYIAEGLLALTAYTRNITSCCDKHLMISDSTPDMKKLLKMVLAGSDVQLHFPSDMQYCSVQENALSKKYITGSDRYRWGMKAVMIQELLNSGYDMALYIDPDIYTVSEVEDIHRILHRYDVSVFPHFRDPDKETSRKYLYRDGFFNGGMLAATLPGIKAIRKLSERCIEEMTIESSRNLYDDQKYYNYFITEVENLYINHDRGVDYNAWNDDAWLGFVGPSQRSYLLKVGVFARIWHMAYGDMLWLKDTPEILHKSHLFVICVYIYTNILIMLLVLIKMKIYPATKNIESTFLNSNWIRLTTILTTLAPKCNMSRIRSLYDNLSINKTFDASILLSEWYECVMYSFCYDNLEVFAQLVDMLFHENGEEISIRLRRNDLRYITESIEGKFPISLNMPSNKLEERSTGEILDQYLRNLKSANILY